MMRQQENPCCTNSHLPSSSIHFTWGSLVIQKFPDVEHGSMLLLGKQSVSEIVGAGFQLLQRAPLHVL